MKFGTFIIGVIFLGVAAAKLKSDYEKCLKYLVKYEWMEDPKLESPTNEELRAVVKSPLEKLQKLYKLQKTGECDAQTLEFMSKPRCGNSDASASGIHDTPSNATGTRRKRWVRIDGVPLWTDPEYGFSFPISLGFENYHPSMTKGDQEDALIYCASRWAEQSGLSFRLAFDEPTANIFISFVPEIEDDPGEFGVLAMAESPTPFRKPPRSTIQFDAREPWVAKFTRNQPVDTLSFQAVLCHEMGHSLALDHSTDRKAVMFGELISQNKEVMLNQDDINGIQALYGQPNGIVLVNGQPAPQPDNTRGRVSPTPSPQPQEDRCSGLRTRRQRQACSDRNRRRRGRTNSSRRNSRRNTARRGRSRNNNRQGRRTGRFGNSRRG